jgi:hypothetical protein
MSMNSLIISQAENTIYLELQLDRRLNWKKHIFIKRKQLRLQLEQIYWLLSQ